MSDDWERTKLGDVLKLEYGKPLPDANRAGNGKYPVYGANGEKARSDSWYHASPSIIIGRKGSAGEIRLSEEKFWPLDVTYFATFDRSRFDLKFLYYLLITLELPSMARGVKPGINRNDVYALGVSIPALREQQRIVAILDEAFAGIAAAKANAEKKLKSIGDLFAGLSQQLFPQDSRAPATHSLEELCEAIVDCEHKTAPTQAEGIPSIRTPNIGKGELLLDGVYRVSEETYREWTRRAEPSPGDLIMAREAPAGNVAVIPDGTRVCLGQRTVLLKPKREVFEPSYLAHLLLQKNSQ